MNSPLEAARLYAILDMGYVSDADAERVCGELVRGGSQIVQLRAKGRSPETVLHLAARLSPICREHGVPFIINDYPQLVRESGADGAHVGQGDMTVSRARELAGPNAIIGKSTHSLAQARAAFEEKPDYIGFGPLFATPTKPEYAPVGLDEVGSTNACAPVPVFCIGGIKTTNLAGVLAAGARRAVLVSGLLLAPDIAAECRAARAILDSVAG